MNDKIKKSQDPISLKWILMSVIAFAVIYSANCLLLSPVITILSSDVLYSETALPIILGYVRELFELFAITVCYAAMICILYRTGKESIRAVFVLFAAATAYKYIANMIVSWVMSGSIPSLWVMDIINAVFYTLLEFVQLFIIYLLIRPIIERFAVEKRMAKKRSEILGDDQDVGLLKPYPFVKIYDKKNCLCRSAYTCALVVFIAKLFGDVSSDLWFILLGGLPTDPITWLLMAANYISKAVFAIIAYFLIYAVMTLMLKRS